MLDPAILEFLELRKNERLKKKITASMTDGEQAIETQKIQEAFQPAVWIADAAKRAGQLSLVSHPPKFSHPSIVNKEVSLIKANAKRSDDGYLRTGNIISSLDVVGNAAALDVLAFLRIILNDGKSVLQHIEEDSETIQQQLSFPNHEYDVLKDGFLNIKSDQDPRVRTHGSIKQVYFPIEDSRYHLLSILTPSAIMFDLKNRIREMKTSEQAKEAREDRRKNQLNETGFSDIYGLTLMGFGGSNAQNISIFNAKNYGETYLLPCLPPTLTANHLRLPKTDFFKNCINPWQLKESFMAFDRLIQADQNNIDIRTGRDNIMGFIFERVIEKAWQIRQTEAGWTQKEAYQNLPLEQKIWLDNLYKEERETNDECLEKIKETLSHWFLSIYSKSKIIQRPKPLGAEQISHVKAILEQQVENLMGGLR
jgi:CRISPR-associated protein Csy1